MKILFVTGAPFYPDALGGSETSMHALLSMLQQRGHECEAVAALPGGWRLQALRVGRRISGRRWIAARDTTNGYATYRTWQWLTIDLFQRRLQAFRPDVVVAQFEPGPLLAAVARCAPQVVVRVVDQSFQGHESSVPRDPHIRMTANSRYISALVHERFGKTPALVYPIVRTERYRTAASGRQFVTLINPARSKGRDLVLAVADRLRHREFLLVESWTLPPAEREALLASIASRPNVHFRPRGRDMRSVYADTSVLLVPSVKPEAFGRVILEAHANGIPVIARDVGGVAEALGDGGVLLRRDSVAADWAEAVERVMSNGDVRRSIADRARRNAARPQFDPEHIADVFLTQVCASR